MFRLYLGGGLSPRVRGNPGGAASPRSPGRSIPACAGEPDVTSHPALSVAVYPRVCGGTTVATRTVSSSAGLSPRVRGNRGGGSGRLRRTEVYPRVCGGTRERRPHRRPALQRVYPRVCGGTFTRVHRWAGAWMRGLSPRVRGNRASSAEGNTPIESGLSPRVRGNHRDHRAGCTRRKKVYPRVCGGTQRPGLAPSITRSSRSIPACAGEPSGGTTSAALDADRSIPACAGEPAQMYTLSMATGVIVMCAGNCIDSAVISALVRTPGFAGRKDLGLSKNYSSWEVSRRRDRMTPSWSTNSTGGSPMTRTICPLVARGSCQVMTMHRPPSSSNHSAMTAHTRSRTATESLGDV